MFGYWLLFPITMLFVVQAVFTIEYSSSNTEFFRTFEMLQLKAIGLYCSTSALSSYERLHMLQDRNAFTCFQLGWVMSSW